MSRENCRQMTAFSTGQRVDPKTVHPLDGAILGAALLALIFSFFDYYTYAAKGLAKQGCAQISQFPGPDRAALQDLCAGAGYGAWHGFFGWFGVLLAVLGAGLVALPLVTPSMRLPVPARRAAPGAFLLGLIATLLSLVVIPDWPGLAALGGTSSQYDMNVDEGPGLSYWIVLVLIGLGAVLCLVRFQQAGPRRGASAADHLAPLRAWGRARRS